MESTDQHTPTYSLKALILYFLKLGTWGFGGPVALVGYMHRDLVDRKQWISEDDYREGMALSQLAPGPLAAQLSIYIGYVHYHILGATLVGLAFVFPSFLMVLGISWAYVSFGGIPWMQAIFYGVGAAVIGIITISSYKLTTKSIGKDLWLWGIFIVLAVFTFVTEEENIWLILASGILIWLRKSPPSFSKKPLVMIAWPALLQIPATVTTSGKLWQIAWFFTKAGAFVFGSGLAIVPFLYGGVVKEYHWLNEQQFVDAVAVAMITPGPVVITVGFIGFLVSGFAGAAVAALGVFLPCFVFTVLPAPYFKKISKNTSIKAFVDGITAAVVGALVGSVFVIATRSIVDLASALIAVVTILALIYIKKLQEPYVILAAAILGFCIKTYL